MMNKIKGAQSMHQQLIDHYKSRRSAKHSKNIKIQSIVKQTLQKKVNEQDQQSPYQDFLRNQQHIATQAQPLDFRSLPRDLKVFFPGPPPPPPPLKQIPYTYEMVGLVPYKMPKQKKGTVGSWVLQQSNFVERRNHSVSEQKNVERYLQGHKDMTEKKNIFRKAIKQLATRMKEQNLSLGQIKKNKGLVKKSFNYYNSKQFFAMIKAGEKQSQFLLQSNPYLAFDVDQFKMTPLHWAAREGHSYLTKILLQKFRANTGSKDMYGRTPLHLAVAKKQIPCIIRIFIQGGQLNSLDNQKRNVRTVAPDAYTKYLLEKLQQVKFIIRAKGLRDVSLYRQQLQKHVKYVLDEASLYF